MQYYQIPTLKTVATPGNPPAGFLKLYFKSDGKLYSLDDSGVETDLSASGGGAVDSVNGQTGVVVLSASDVGAYSDTNPDGFITNSALANYVEGPASSTDNNIPQYDGVTGKLLKDGLSVSTSIGTPGVDTSLATEKAVRDAIVASGSGDVSGPASSTDDNFAVFNGITGKQIKDASKAIPGGDVVGTTDTQTLTNKTLTSPIINVGSDVEGDLYYRDSSGNFIRLGIGSDGQVLRSDGSVPVWENVSYTHSQGASSITRSITHNLGSDNVIVQIYNSSDNMIMPDSVVINNTNSITVSFTSNQTGKAVILAA